MAALGTSPQGLPESEASSRLKRFGLNAVEERKDVAAFRLFLRQFESPLVLILVLGAFLSLALAEWTEASIILAIIGGSAILGFLQEHRASKAVAALHDRLALTGRVLRDGQEKIIKVEFIVPGDIILLSAGNLVPCDGLVLEAKDFLVSEASLTGESYPVEKQPGILPSDTQLAHRTNAVFLGTSVRSGTAKVLAVHTGKGTIFGAVAARLKSRPLETEFARGIRQFGYMLIRVVVVMALFALTINQLLHRPFVDSLLFSIALTVGLSPELLPAIISVTLANGARAMEKVGVIVRKLESIENLGSMNILCTDKTGTLTEGLLTLEHAVDKDGKPSAEVKRYACLNAAFETGIENPLDAAILKAGERDGFSTQGFIKIDEIPYDFLRKRLTIVVAEQAAPGTNIIIAKGAFDNILAVCAKLSEEQRKSLADYYRRKGEEGYKVLAMGIRKLPAKERYSHDDETGITFAGFLLFTDSPKPEAAKAVTDLAVLGVAVKIISGDNRYVTAHVAKAIGLNHEAILTGQDIQKMSDEALWQKSGHTDLFVEVDPQQKERIVRALQKMGNAVGYMGDGINDAPALHAADVGISVDTAVDIARESADIVLLRRDLDVLRQGIGEGRRTFSNTLKYINITISANFGNMISMVLITPFLPFLPMTAAQILLNNFLSDIPLMTLSTDNVDPETISGATRWHIRDVLHFMAFFGLISTIFDLLTCVVLQQIFKADVSMFQTTWFVFSLLTELMVALVLRTRRPLFSSRPGRLLLLTTCAAAFAALAIPYVTLLNPVFGFIALPLRLIAAMFLLIAFYLLMTEGAKVFFYRKRS